MIQLLRLERKGRNQKRRQAIRKARRANPDAKIIVTGCAAQTEPETYAAMPEVDRVIGNREKLVFKSEARAPGGLKLNPGQPVEVRPLAP